MKLDSYEWRARLTPGLLAGVPVALLVVTLGLKKFPVVAVSSGVLTAAGGGYLISVLVAHFGRQAQKRLWREWGGPPTTQLLRVENCATNPTQREIWRAALQRLTGVSLLSSRREAANPQAAAEAIEAAINQVRNLGQDARYPLVAAENTQYGFERNLYGFRWFGRLIALACTLTLGGCLVADWHSVSTTAVAIGLIADSCLLLGWLCIPSQRRARAAGFRYAEQLLQAVVNASKSTTADSGGS